MDLLSPVYNTLKTAYSSLGYKHSGAALEKVQENLAKFNKKKAEKVVITNLDANVSEEYESLRAAGKALGTNKTTLKEYILKSKVYKGNFKVEANLSESNYDSNYLNHPTSKQIVVEDLQTGNISYYDSIRAAARALDLGHFSIATYLKRSQKTPFKGRFIFSAPLPSKGREGGV